MRRLCAAVLTFESIVLLLLMPVAITVGNVPPAVTIPVGLGLMLACLLVAGSLKRAWAYRAGWAIQVIMLGLGILVPIMFILGAVFGALWWMAIRLGRQVEEREQAAEDAAHEGGWGPPTG